MENRGKSRDCKVKCIDKGYVFCPTASRASGYCCDPLDDRCLREDANCSSGAPDDATALQYYMCPNDRYVCGVSTDLTARKEAVLESNDVYSDLLSGGALCRYRIKFPEEAMHEDKVAVKLNKLENVQLHAIKTKDF